MNVDLALLSNLIRKRSDEIEKSVAGTGYLARTVIRIGTFPFEYFPEIPLSVFMLTPCVMACIVCIYNIHEVSHG